MSRFEKIEGYDNYLISDDGNVYSLNYGRLTKLSPRVNKGGYLYVNLCKNGKYKSVRIHRLVAKHFLPDYDENLQVNHIDGNKMNNKLSNIEMVTQSGNLKHAVKMGLLVNPKGEEHWCAKLSEEKVKEIRKKYKPHIYTQKMLADEYGVSRSNIKFILANKIWKDIAEE